MAMVGSDMAGSIVDALVTAGKYPGLSAGDIVTLKEDMSVYCVALIQYLTDNMVVKDVSISSGTTLLNSPTPLVPVPSDGGAAVSAQMVANAVSNTLNQNNNGTGHIE